MDHNLKMPIEEVDASELWEAYNSVRRVPAARNVASGSPQKTMGSDGKFYHSECRPLLSRGW